MTIIKFIKYEHEIFLKKTVTLIKIFLCLPFYIIAPVILIMVYLISPWFLVRFQPLQSGRIGHFALNTELYCCERDMSINLPNKPYLDLFYFHDICNKQLAKMWKRELKVFPRWLLNPIFKTNSFFSKFFSILVRHEFSESMSNYRDVKDLLKKSKPHVNFSSEEEIIGKEQLKKFGLSQDSKFICLNVRDEAYLKNYLGKDWSYHDYRNAEIDDFILASEEITQRGYFVFRMGKKVKKPIKTSNSMIIDYANSGMRSDFMDIYLGANCTFCLSTSAGFNSIVTIFRRPIASITVPLSFIETFVDNSLFITKHYYSKKKEKNLTLSEISFSNISCMLRTEEYEKRGIKLIDNTPEEIRDLALEMIGRLEGNWKFDETDNKLQEKFWSIYLSSDYNKFFNDRQLHGKIRGKFGAKYLRNNPKWLQ